jgi:hypothetical protein
MASYEVTIEFEPMVVQIELDGEFDIESINQLAVQMDGDGQIYHDNWWVGYVEDEEGEQVWAC